MDCPPPEATAVRFFCKCFVPVAFVLLDGYAYHGHVSQKAAMDGFARENWINILSLRIGQSLLVKSARAR